MLETHDLAESSFILADVEMVGSGVRLESILGESGQ